MAVELIWLEEAGSVPFYTANPTSDPATWFVWDVATSVADMQPVFWGTMEDCGLVADALNRRVEISVSEHFGAMR